MGGPTHDWGWMANTGLGGLLVLAAGSLAACLCRQPVRRARIVLLTLLGGAAVPCLETLPIAPRWSTGLLEGTTAPSQPATSNTVGLPARALVSPVAAVGRTLENSRPVDAGYRSNPPRPGLERRPPALAVTTVLGVAYSLSAGAMAAWWLCGQALLWRLTRAASPAPPPVRELFLGIAGPAGRRVRLLECEGIASPFTYTWVRPVIVLPTGLGDAGGRDALRYVLSHEWSHVRRHDSWAWNLVSLAGIVLFHQPLFWWLRRQLRLCQDYLADAQAAAAGSAEDYAAFLVRLARQGRAGRPLPALGIGDRRSYLSRRVVMLVQRRDPLEQRCRTGWSLAAAFSAVVLTVFASCLRLDAAPPDDKAVAAPAKPAEAAPKADAGRTWKGRITEKGTGMPIAGAEVVVEISVSRDKTTNDWKTLREVRQTTGADGAYEFTLTREEEADRYLYITLRVEARDHVNYFGGYGYAMILKNEKLGERPFYEDLSLAPGAAVEGVVKTPDGTPAGGVKVQAFSAPDPERVFDDGRWAETKTDAQGHFRLVLHRKGKAVVWVLPQDYSPETHGLKDGRRGDLGTFTLDPGVRFGGKVLDAQGKPVAGVYVEADLQEERGADDAVPNGVADMKHRATLTGTDGSFAFRPLPPGKYRVYPSEGGWDPSTRDGAHDPPRRPLPAVFTAQTVALKEGETPDAVEIRASPHVVVEAQLYNSKGEKRPGHEVSLVGRIDGGFWSAEGRCTADGVYRILAPHGLDDAQLSLMTNEHSVLQFRTSKDAPLRHSRNIRLGTLDHDVQGIEIIRYEAPIIVIGAATKDGKPVQGIKPSVDYTEPDPQRGGKFILKGGGHSDVSLEQQGDRFRTSQLAPDREVLVTVQADGFAPASRKLKLAEGKVEEVTLVLEPK